MHLEITIQERLKYPEAITQLKNKTPLQKDNKKHMTTPSRIKGEIKMD